MKIYMENEDGFTLVELLIIIGIISILTTIGIMSSRESMIEFRLNGAARQLYSDMQYARLNAVKGGKEWLVDFNADGSYVVKPKVVIPADNDRIKSVDIPAMYANVKLCQMIDIEFNPNGSVDLPKGSSVISLGALVKKVYISSAGTGNVRIAKPGDAELASVTPCP